MAWISASLADGGPAHDLAMLPIGYHPRLDLVADLDCGPSSRVVVVQRARLDRPVAPATEEYMRLAQPWLERITAPRPAPA